MVCIAGYTIMIYKNSKQIHAFSNCLIWSNHYCIATQCQRRSNYFSIVTKKIFSYDISPLYGGDAQAPEFLTDSLIPLSSAKDTTRRTGAAQLFWATHCEWQEIGQTPHLCRTSTLSHQPAATSWQTVYTYRGSSRSAGFLWLEGTFPWVLEPSWWHELHTTLPINTHEDTQWRNGPTINTIFHFRVLS